MHLTTIQERLKKMLVGRVVGDFFYDIKHAKHKIKIHRS